MALERGNKFGHKRCAILEGKKSANGTAAAANCVADLSRKMSRGGVNSTLFILFVPTDAPV